MKHKLFLSLIVATMFGSICTSCKDAENVQQNVALQPQTGNSLADLDVYFDSIAPRFMGSIMITKGDSLIYSKNIGYSDVDKKIAISDSTQFKIGSISKSFTAVLVLKAIESGKLSMEDKLIKFFPNSNITNADKITIYHLLHHRSGLQDFINETRGEFITYRYQHLSKEQLLEKFSRLASNFEPGDHFSYTNTGYILLAFILENVYSKTYAELINEQIAQPLGLNHTFDCSNGDRTAPYSYRYDYSWTKAKSEYPLYHLGSGSIVSSTKDLQKYTYALANGFFGKYVFDQMTDFVEGYGCGIGGAKFGDKLAIGHAGHTDDFWSSMTFQDGSVITFLSNTTGVWHESIVWSITCALKGDEFNIPSLHFVSLDSTQLNQYIGEFRCNDHTLKFSNDGKNLICDDSESIGWPTRVEAKNENFFQCFEKDYDVVFNPTRDSLKYRRGGERRIYVRQK